jgi:hypothetical protein
MELLGDVADVESHFTPFGGSASVDARLVHGLRQMYDRLRNHFRRTRWYFWVTRLKWMLFSVRLVIVLMLTQDRCMFCAERTKRLGNRFGRT